MRAGLRGSWSKMSFRYLVSTSTISREFANTIVFKPALIAARAMRVVCERAEARNPRSALMTGGFHSSRCFSPCGAPLSVIAVTSSPTNCAGKLAGLAIVAEQKMKTGSAP